MMNDDVSALVHIGKSIAMKKEIDKLVKKYQDRDVNDSMIIFLLNKKIKRMMGD